ncbi:MAG TPA: winged helix-turn-helix domain-containing protein [Sphingomicrobium sp.]|jgi:DNA-binding winged helix-turn-helix (wHTH) protein/tetratricopeptide (TPR) repeat protein|nr:winged helix-turn-helix domain-containing protein [Sphingomicrobium sp.]
MLKLADLARRADFAIGPLHVSPARRLVEGPVGSTTVEPIVMKVFLLLLDGAGSVVTRDELFGNAWGGVYVGDDSLNRAVARVRKIASDTAPGLFEIETIPRTGYRLTGGIIASIDETHRDASSAPRISRRLMIGSAAGVALAGAAGLSLWSIRSADDRRFDELMEHGEKSLDYGDPSANRAQYFRDAVALRPDSAKAQGLLAYSRVLDVDNDPRHAAAAVEESAQAARAALAIDPKEPNARLAQTILQRSTLDLAETEDRLRDILATDPINVRAMRFLWSLLQCVGRSRDSLALIERAVAIKPLAAANNYPRAQLLWILGRYAEADRVIDAAMEYWPEHQYVRFAKFTILAFTGRARAALAMLDKTPPQGFSPEAIDLWRMSLPAIDDPSNGRTAAVRAANLDAGKKDAKLAFQAVMTLSALGDADGAFQVVNSLFVVPPRSQFDATKNRAPVKSTAWRFAPWLFVPPTKLLRADRRFDSLCDTIGLTEYWDRRRIKPDYQLGIY